GTPVGDAARPERSRLHRAGRPAGVGRPARARPRRGVRLGRSDGRGHAPLERRGTRRCASPRSPFGPHAALAVALLLGLISARRLSRPITQLAESTRAVSEGQYGVSVKVTGTAELADLSENFNRMSESIRDAIENLKRAARENHELFINSIRALAAAIDAKDPYTRGHSEGVARYAAQVAREMGLTPEDVRRVRLSALLHDVGKIGIDDRILRKPTALTEEE